MSQHNDVNGHIFKEPILCKNVLLQRQNQCE